VPIHGLSRGAILLHSSRTYGGRCMAGRYHVSQETATLVFSIGTSTSALKTVARYSSEFLSTICKSTLVHSTQDYFTLIVFNDAAST
jgi:hypothetical protein